MSIFWVTDSIYHCLSFELQYISLVTILCCLNSVHISCHQNSVGFVRNGKSCITSWIFYTHGINITHLIVKSYLWAQIWFYFCYWPTSLSSWLCFFVFFNNTPPYPKLFFFIVQKYIETFVMYTATTIKWKWKKNICIIFNNLWFTFNTSYYLLSMFTYIYSSTLFVPYKINYGNGFSENIIFRTSVLCYRGVDFVQHTCLWCTCVHECTSACICLCVHSKTLLFLDPTSLVVA